MYFKLNEEIKVRNNKKLRDAIHDIVVTLEVDEYFDVSTISNILRDDFNIFLSPKLLERFIVYWNDSKDSIFSRDDNKWLFWDSSEQFIENNLIRVKKRGVLGKSRRRLIKKEKDDRIKTVRKSGWIKIKDGRFVYYGPKSFKITDKDEITITKYEKEKYEKYENPITPELISKIFILDHPDDAIEYSNSINNDIKMDKITSNPKHGGSYYDECFKLMIKIAKEEELDTKRGWDKKYAPSLLKKRILRKKKRKDYEEEQESESLKTVITDRDKSLEELKTVIDIDKKYYILLTKYNTTKKIFMIKKIVYNNITISEDKYEDGYYKIIDKDNIVFFQSMLHFKRAIEGGIKDDKGNVFNVIEDDETTKIKIFFDQLKRYKGWDEFISDDVSNKLKNDF